MITLCKYSLIFFQYLRNEETNIMSHFTYTDDTNGIGKKFMIYISENDISAAEVVGLELLILCDLHVLYH